MVTLTFTQCNFVQDLVDDVFEEIWPDIQDQVLFQIRLKYADPYATVDFKPPKRCCLLVPWFWLRNWYLYAFIPCMISRYLSRPLRLAAAADLLLVADLPNKVDPLLRDPVVRLQLCLFVHR